MSKEHFEALSNDKSHVAGEDNGCVTRCIYETQSGKMVCTFKGHGYKENGFNYQKGCHEADWYNLPIHEEGSDARKRFNAIFSTAFKQEWRDPSKRAQAWYMGAGPYGHLNFVGSGRWPWSNNAHHIVPVDDVLSKLLTVDELKTLQQAKYNVNKGINIIYLPNGTRHATLFQLLKHPRYHSTYSMDVRARVNSIRKSLTAAADKEREKHPEATPETLPRLGEQLHAFSNRTRQDIRDAGVMEPGAHLNKLFELLDSR
ncbi:AHH domain-containing protein [Myxococcus sp. AB036A]|uniref:AHH domain-containing protein n=1 Tax=Myxococcus sp. AB036A TaxID=2562793 RepID=UPI0011474E99|nr:AHH domain-containing protein [Myxococcus sp. AB036A]